MNDSERPEGASRSEQAGGERQAEDRREEISRRDEAGELRTKDHLPPITISDSSFVVEISKQLGPRKNSGKPARPHRYESVHPLFRILVIDGNGDTLYKNTNASGCELQVWMDDLSPDDPPQVVLKDEEAGRSAFEIDHEFETPDSNTVSKFRPFVYRHPRNDEDNFFVHRLRVVKGGQMLFQYIVNPNHPAGLQVWLWDKGL